MSAARTSVVSSLSFNPRANPPPHPRRMISHGAAAVLRIVPERILTAEELGLPPAIADLANLQKGLVLVTGPTGSGKSTTLAAVIDAINRNHARHIVTIGGAKQRQTRGQKLRVSCRTKRVDIGIDGKFAKPVALLPRHPVKRAKMRHRRRPRI